MLDQLTYVYNLINYGMYINCSDVKKMVHWVSYS